MIGSRNACGSREIRYMGNTSEFKCYELSMYVCEICVVGGTMYIRVKKVVLNPHLRGGVENKLLRLLVIGRICTMRRGRYQ